MDKKLRLRLVHSSKEPGPTERPLDLAGARGLIRSLVRAGADFNFHREAIKNRDEANLRDTDIRNMLSSGKVERQEATAAFESPQFIVIGRVEEQKENRRIQKEFAVTVAVERPQKPGLLGVIRIRQLRERGD